MQNRHCGESHSISLREHLQFKGGRILIEQLRDVAQHPPEDHVLLHSVSDTTHEDLGPHLRIDCVLGLDVAGLHHHPHSECYEHIARVTEPILVEIRLEVMTHAHPAWKVEQHALYQRLEIIRMHLVAPKLQADVASGAIDPREWEWLRHLQHRRRPPCT